MSYEPKILYVDDEEDLVLLAQAFFEEEDLKLDISSDFNEALKKIRTNHYDIVITDSRMPTGNGEELLRTIKAEGRFKGKFILVTGEIEFRAAASHQIFDLVVYKPIHFQSLIDDVRKILMKSI